LKLTFLGTRAWIDAKSERHRRHSALLIAYHGWRLMVDCGEDWRPHLAELAPDAIVLTHAHPDHAFGLADGAPCPVFATEASWADLGAYPLDDRRTLPRREPTPVLELGVEAFPVLHATRCPTVALRIEAGGSRLVYAPDVVDIEERAAALAGVDLFIGDGVSLTRSHVRRAGGSLVGHTTIRAQLGWCAEAGVTRALFTHCGREIVEGDERRLRPKLEAMGRERGVAAGFAHDGMEVALGDRP
jgi:ribonuclease BN (tRNA processing enzyme)